MEATLHPQEEEHMFDRGESMNSKIFTFVVILSMIASANALAQERKLEGEISVTGVAPKIEGQKAKFNEYRDIRDGVYAGVDLRYDAEKYYLDFKAEDVGYKTQKYGLEGGKWGSFKYHFDYNEIPHNFTYGAKSFYTGIGGANLTYPTHPPSTNISTWTTFDYSLERTNYGGGIKLDMLKPFYFDVSFNKDQRKGIYPFGAAGTTPGGLSVELPAPIDFVTDNLKLEAGYAKNPFSFSLGYFYSEFRNNNGSLNFRDPATVNTAATTDSLTLPPNNSYYKLQFKGAVKLPLNSKFNANLATSSAQSSGNLFDSYVADVTAATSNIGVQGRTGVILSSRVFNGKVDTQNYDFLLTSSPLYFLDGKIFYKYYNTSNRSDQITTTDSSALPATFTNDLFDYRKEKYGAELGFKLPVSFYLTTAYTRVQTKRTVREDIPKNDDDIYGIDLRWSGLDFMVAKVGYERLQRRGDFEGPTVTDPTDVNNIEQFVRRFDVAPRDRDTYKAAVDFFPMENLNFSLGYKYKDTNYKDTILGLRSDKRSEFTIDGDYLIAKRVRLFAYFDYEYVKLDQFQRQLPSPTTSYNPALPPTSTAFNWTVNQTETNYGYGLGADIYIIPQKLTLKLQHNSFKSDGFADYTYLRNFAAADGSRTQDNIDINNWGSYETRYYLAKVIYGVTKSLSLSAGYAYEKYIYDDAQYNGYSYLPTSATGATLGYLTGAYNAPSYEAHVVFLGVAFRF
jgi:MtrB/PioB family decaheme-associated outer membrane protein